MSIIFVNISRQACHQAQAPDRARDGPGPKIDNMEGMFCHVISSNEIAARGPLEDAERGPGDQGRGDLESFVLAINNKA